jgi:hypothetical protein
MVPNNQWRSPESCSQLFVTRFRFLTSCFYLLLQPVTQVVTPSAYAAGYTAVTTKFPTGREQFTTFYPCAAFSSDCLLTAHMYFAWGMHGIIPGSRDAQFSVQVRPRRQHAACCPTLDRDCMHGITPGLQAPARACCHCIDSVHCLHHLLAAVAARAVTCLVQLVSGSLFLARPATDRRPVPVHGRAVRPGQEVPHDRC